MKTLYIYIFCSFILVTCDVGSKKQLKTEHLLPDTITAKKIINDKSGLGRHLIEIIRLAKLKNYDILGEYFIHNAKPDNNLSFHKDEDKYIKGDFRLILIHFEELTPTNEPRTWINNAYSLYLIRMGNKIAYAKIKTIRDSVILEYSNEILLSKLKTISKDSFRISNYFKEPLEEVRQLVENKNYKNLIIFLQSISRKNSNYQYSEILSRQIVGDYYEKEIEFQEPSIYQINIVINGDKIVYAKLIGNGGNYFHKTQSDTLIKELSNEFKTEYYKDIKLDSFFNKVVYGTHCGIAGIQPEYRTFMEKLVSERNAQSLEKWLCSETAEIQLYGMEGLYELKKKGYNLTIKQQKLIKIIKSKNGNLRTCSGCIYDQESIKGATSSFKF